MKDGSLKITLVTRELNPKQMAEIFVNLNKEVTAIELPEDNSDIKSPSTRLRNCMFRLWEKEGKEKYETFELYYRSKMEQIINMLKDKLN